MRIRVHLDCIFYKVHIFWEGHKILQNLHLTFDYSTYSQKLGEDLQWVAFSEYTTKVVEFHANFSKLDKNLELGRQNYFIKAS